MRVLWELREGPLGAREILARCDGLSSSVLYERLRQLVHAELVEQGDSDAYHLTKHGAALGAALEPLDAWATGWSRSIKARRPPNG